MRVAIKQIVSTNLDSRVDEVGPISNVMYNGIPRGDHLGLKFQFLHFMSDLLHMCDMSCLNQSTNI